MAGTIAISKDRWWSVSSWAYHWVLDYLIENVEEGAVVEQLREIDAENLGWLGLDDFSAEQRAMMLDTLRDELVPDAESRLLVDDDRHEAAVDVIRQLAVLAAEESRRA